MENITHFEEKVSVEQYQCEVYVSGPTASQHLEKEREENQNTVVDEGEGEGDEVHPQGQFLETVQEMAIKETTSDDSNTTSFLSVSSISTLEEFEVESETLSPESAIEDIKLHYSIVPERLSRNNDFEEDVFLENDGENRNGLMSTGDTFAQKEDDNENEEELLEVEVDMELEEEEGGISEEVFMTKLEEYL